MVTDININKRVKKILIKTINYLYDRKMDVEWFYKWKKDLMTQRILDFPTILSIDDTLDIILKAKLSVCRYGDGEFKIMDGDSIFFQEYDRLLATRLKRIIKSVDGNTLICIPSYINREHSLFFSRKLQLNKEEKQRRKNSIRYLDNILAERRKIWYEYFSMDKIYGDSLISRFYADKDDDSSSERWIQKWKRIWEDRNILIVEGEKTRLGVGNNLFENANQIKRILAPNNNAFFHYDKILNTIRKQYSDELVIIALGPTATVLAYDLSLAGIQALDVGHIDIEYEWYLRRDRTHKRIEGKYVSEAKDGYIVSMCNDQNYSSQIVEWVRSNE